MKFALSAILAATLLLAEPLTKKDRDYAMSHLHATRKLVLDVAAPLSESQWKFKPGPERWSIAECLEHITETEKMLFGLVQKTLAEGKVDEAKRASRKATADERNKGLLTMMVDRSKPASAPTEVRPTGRFASKEASISTFKDRRDQTIKYVETTEDDLRGHFFTLGPSESDLYEMVLIISGHTERHVLQMKEVMANPNFPKK